MSQLQALHAYKAALRATRIAFNGDAKILTAARLKVREGFEENRNLEDQEKIQESLKSINEVAVFLTRNVVQGEQNDDGRYLLKFHDKIELGSNETIRQNNKANMGSLANAKVTKRT